MGTAAKSSACKSAKKFQPENVSLMGEACAIGRVPMLGGQKLIVRTLVQPKPFSININR
jgi:hypothetical protein